MSDKPSRCRNHSSRSASSRMVTTSLRRGSTTLACFQNSASVGCSSGSDSILSLIWVSFSRRNKSQSVLRLTFEALTEVAPFVRLCVPRRDDMPLVIFPVRLDHRDFQFVHKADGVDSNFAIVELIIDPLNGRPLEDPPSILEGEVSRSSHRLSAEDENCCGTSPRTRSPLDLRIYGTGAVISRVAKSACEGVRRFERFVVSTVPHCAGQYSVLQTARRFKVYVSDLGVSSRRIRRTPKDLSNPPV